jgi:hypothetical protein
MPRHKSTERAPEGRLVRIVLDGQEHEGRYTVDGTMVIVESLLLGFKCARVGDTTPEALAKLMLAQLVYDNADRGRG